MTFYSSPYPNSFAPYLRDSEVLRAARKCGEAEDKYNRTIYKQQFTDTSYYLQKLHDRQRKFSELTGMSWPGKEQWRAYLKDPYAVPHSFSSFSPLDYERSYGHGREMLTGNPTTRRQPPFLPTRTLDGRRSASPTSPTFGYSGVPSSPISSYGPRPPARLSHYSSFGGHGYF